MGLYYLLLTMRGCHRLGGTPIEIGEASPGVKPHEIGKPSGWAKPVEDWGRLSAWGKTPIRTLPAQGRKDALMNS